MEKRKGHWLKLKVVVAVCVCVRVCELWSLLYETEWLKTYIKGHIKDHTLHISILNMRKDADTVRKEEIGEERGRIRFQTEVQTA